MLERHDLLRGGYYWKSYDFGGDDGQRNLRQFPDGPEEIGALPYNMFPFKHDGGEMIFSLPNGMQGYYLSLANGDAIQVGPTDVVSFRDRQIGKGVEIINGRSCFSCHSDGIISKQDLMREHIEASSLFSLDQRDHLLAMYVNQEDLDQAYDQDRQRFVSSLQELDISITTNLGNVQAMSGPDGRAEIITWYADLYEEDLDFEGIAAEFGLTPNEFTRAVQRIGDPDTLRISLDWSNRLAGGLSIPRIELESQFPYLVGFINQLRPLDTQYANQHEVIPERYANTINQENGEPLKLSLNLASMDVHVDDLLTFEITANRDCLLQVFYIQANGEIVEFPETIVGSPLMRGGVAKQIPDANSSMRSRFAEAAIEETLVTYCRASHLESQKLSAAQAYEMIVGNGVGAGATKLIFEVIERAKGTDTQNDETVNLIKFRVLH